MEVLDPADTLVRSDQIAYPARHLSSMDMEEARPALSTPNGMVSEERDQAMDLTDDHDISSHTPRHPSSSSSTATSTPPTATGSANSRSHMISPQHTQHSQHVPEPPQDPHAQSLQTPSHATDGTTLGGSDQQPPHNGPPPSPRLQPSHDSIPSLNGSAQTSPSRIKVRDLSHIQSFASEEVLTRSRQPSRHSLRGRIGGGQQYEISAMPVQDIIEMVAGLLTKITTTNDRQHEHLHRHIPDPDGSTTLSQQAKSVLAFHGKNVPSITIASYLGRIHKYCPTTYEVFLSLLVYFDRMTEMVNSGSLASFGENGPYNNSNNTNSSRPGTAQSNSSSLASSDLAMPNNPSSPTNQAFRPTTRQSQSQTPTTSNPQDRSGPASASIPPTLSDADAYDISHFFVVDSFNIHRLVMAGVTCASKFFSDVFYTNSRYAKVSRATPISFLFPFPLPNRQSNQIKSSQAKSTSQPPSQPKNLITKICKRSAAFP